MIQKLHFVIVVLLLSMPQLVRGQSADLSVFDNLVNKTWIAEGQWENNGPKFRQEVKFTYGLEKTIVIAESKGFINEEQTKFGDRNHGIRQFDKATNSIKFWEFDIFGNVTKGTVMTKGKSIIYQYQYGESIVTDMWEYVDDNTYNFKVGNYNDGNWVAIYLNTSFKVK